jgi:hypothetical protein
MSFVLLSSSDKSEREFNDLNECNEGCVLDKGDGFEGLEADEGAPTGIGGAYDVEVEPDAEAAHENHEAGAAPFSPPPAPLAPDPASPPAPALALTPAAPPPPPPPGVGATGADVPLKFNVETDFTNPLQALAVAVPTSPTTLTPSFKFKLDMLFPTTLPNPPTPPTTLLFFVARTSGPSKSK